MRLQDPNMKQDLNNNLFVGYPVNGVHYNYKQVGIWQLDEADMAALYGQKPGEVKVADLDGNGVIDTCDLFDIVYECALPWSRVEVTIHPAKLVEGFD